MGVLFAHKRYTPAKYFCVLLITIGVGLFIYKDSKKPDKGLDTDHSFGIGELLLVSIRLYFGYVVTLGICNVFLRVHVKSELYISLN